MAREIVNGIGINYELLGKEGDPAIVLTPGGRFPMVTPGLRQLGEALAAGGKRVLLWDRPNCGQSDLCLDGDSESIMHADTLGQLIRQLGLGPITIAGGSAGSRISLITAARHSDICSHLCIWWITGGNVGLISLAMVYAGWGATAASEVGMQGAVDSFSWAEQCQNNPRIKEALLNTDLRFFLEKMQKWAMSYVPSPVSPVPNMTPQMFADLTMPVLLVRNGFSDFAHTRETTSWVERLIPHARCIESPWPDDEWNQSSIGVREGTRPGLFTAWPKVAPAILDFTR